MHSKTAVKHGEKYGTAWHQHVLVCSDNIADVADSKLDITDEFITEHISTNNTASLSNTKLHRVPPRTSTFYFFNNSSKIWFLECYIMRKFHMKILQVCPPHLSDVTTLPWEIQKKVIFSGIIYTYLWLFALSQTKTDCNPPAHTTWKCHCTNLWIAKLFHLTEGLLHSFKCWGLWKEPVVGCRQWLWQPVVMHGNWNVMQTMSPQVFRTTNFCVNTCFQSFSTLISRIVHHAVIKIQPLSQQASAASLNMSISIHELLL